MTVLFGLPGIFDNVRDGLVLVRFPEGEVVLFNRAAGELCGLAPRAVLGTDFKDLLVDPELQATARQSSTLPVGDWPGHGQDAKETTMRAEGVDTTVEVTLCRVEDAGTGGPLVLFVVRPRVDAAVDTILRELSPRPAEAA